MFKTLTKKTDEKKNGDKTMLRVKMSDRLRERKITYSRKIKKKNAWLSLVRHNNPNCRRAQRASISPSMGKRSFNCRDEENDPGPWP